MTDNRRMGRVGAEIDVDAAIPVVEALWYDIDRWPSFVDGFAHVVKVDGGWPDEGGRLVWQSTPRGRGRVLERVTGHEPGRGQTAEVEDPKLRGVQRVEFEPLADGTAVALALEYQLKEPDNPLRPLVDLLFIRRALRDALQRTLVRFARELEADSELLQ
jgi:Polyketide cyclase / dehydrase and lipid transport